MGVCEEAPKITGMHWQQHERYVGSAYDPSLDLSPNLPVHSSDSSSMGEGDGATSSTTTSSSGTHSTTTDCSNNNNSGTLGTSSACCRVNTTGGINNFDYKLPPPQSPPSCKSEESAVNCGGCGNRIADRFYLFAVDQKWHASCLQCCQCRQTLDGEVTCFSRDGNIYCKKDYYRLFGMKRCGRCQAAISSSELVMRARDLVFHVHCFTCSVCHSALTKGDHFGMHGPNVFCQHHYEIAAANSSPCPVPSVQTPNNYHNSYHTPPFPSPHGDYHSSPVMSQLPPTNPNALPPQPPPNASPCAMEHSSKVQSYFNGAPTARQKGRPRKRKPKDLEGMTANLDLNSDSYLDVATPFGRSGPSPGGGMSHGSNSQSRTKRMRTSFKHHQLRTMKSYFAINHNPDAKDLKQLSQKTGLPKRVLQVWFQNARAKWRRMMIKQEGKIPPEGKGIGSPSDLHDHLHLSGSQSGSEYPMHMGPDGSCSPQYMMPSPPSLDCS